MILGAPDHCGEHTEYQCAAKYENDHVAAQLLRQIGLSEANALAIVKLSILYPLSKAPVSLVSI